MMVLKWVDGVKVIIDEPDEVTQPTGDAVNRERQYRILAGRVFPVTGTDGVWVAGDDVTMRNLQGLAFAAQLRLAQGDAGTVTPYRDESNTIHNLVPAQVVELWSLGSAYISAIYQSSWALKDGESIPADYADDKHWPE